MESLGSTSPRPPPPPPCPRFAPWLPLPWLWPVKYMLSSGVVYLLVFRLSIRLSGKDPFDNILWRRHCSFLSKIVQYSWSKAHYKSRQYIYDVWTYIPCDKLKKFLQVPSNLTWQGRVFKQCAQHYVTWPILKTKQRNTFPSVLISSACFTNSLSGPVLLYPAWRKLKKLLFDTHHTRTVVPAEYSAISSVPPHLYKNRNLLYFLAAKKWPRKNPPSKPH